MIAHLLSRLPVPRPADWGFNVSICIALLTEQRGKIVCVTDERASFESFSGENMTLKNSPFAYDWTALYAGNDVEHAIPIIELARAACSKAQEKKSPNRLTPREIADIFDSAYSEHLQAHIEAKILRKHGFDSESFQASGKSRCTPEVYAKVWDKIDKLKFSLSFLLCGLSPERLSAKEAGHIWCVNGEDAPACYDSIGCWAIGRGAGAALSTLAFYMSHCGLSVNSDVEKSVYAAIAAKFMAEKASDVGTSTFVTISEPNCRENVKFVSLEGVETIRKQWLRKGAPKIPKETVELTKKLIYQNLTTPDEISAAIGKPGLLTKKDVAKLSIAQKSAGQP
jgi:hypothetical protein